MNYTGLILAAVGVIGQIASAHGYNALSLVAADPNTAATLNGLISMGLVLWGGAHTGTKA